MLTMTDIDECAQGTSGCSHICNNTVGSYSCGCPIGYRLADDNRNCMGESRSKSRYYYYAPYSDNCIFCTCLCLDIDECRDNTDSCAQNCINTVGSYSCTCNTGYSLASDRHTCEGRIQILSRNAILVTPWVW